MPADGVAGPCANLAILAALAASLHAVTGASYGSGIAGPWRPVVEHIAPCEPHMLDVPFSISVRLVHNRRNPSNFLVSANATYSVVVDDSLVGLVDFESWSSRGGWKPNALRIRIPMPCKTLKTSAPNLWHRLMESVYGNASQDCPLQAASVSIKDFPCEMDKHLRTFPIFFYGRYRTHWWLLGPGPKAPRFTCLIIISEVVPRLD